MIANLQAGGSEARSQVTNGQDSHHRNSGNTTLTLRRC